METPLSGRVALITGSGRGLGRAIAGRLAELGASVALHDVSQDAPAEFGEAATLEAVAEAFRQRGTKAVGVTGDIGNPEAVAAMVAQVEAELGPIDILVNCAGGDIAAQGGKPKPNDALGVKIEDIRAIFDRNLIGTMLVCKTVCPGMAERQSGAVVNIASIAAHRGHEVEVAYGVAKAGIVHYTRCLALQLRSAGVRVNAVSPGPTRTARFENTRPLDAAKMDETQSSLNRYGVPGEIADAVAFLVGPNANFISGQVLCVDGGLTLHPA